MSEPLKLDEQVSIEDRLSGICADLLSEKRFEPFLLRVFAVAVGIWQSVVDCCSELNALPSDAIELFSTHGKELVVAHLPWPQPDCAEYSVVFLYPFTPLA